MEVCFFTDTHTHTVFDGERSARQPLFDDIPMVAGRGLEVGVGSENNRGVSIRTAPRRPKCWPEGGKGVRREEGGNKW